MNGHSSAHKRTPILIAIGTFAGRHMPAWSVVRTVVMQVLAVICAVAGVFILLGLGAALLAAAAGLLVLEAFSGEPPGR